jgi:hypothetical protein
LRYASRSWSSGSEGGLQQLGASASSVTLLGDNAGSSSDSDAESEGGSGSTSSSSSRDRDALVFLPTQQELRAAGRADLIFAIRQQGGSLAVARRLGWAVHHGRLPSEVDVVQQLLEFAAHQEQAQQEARRLPPPAAAAGAGSSRAPLLAMPTLRQLEAGGRVDLAGAVARLGGVPAFAHLLETEQLRQRRQGPKQQQQQQPVQAPPQPPQRTSQILSYTGRRMEAPPPPQPAVVRVGQALMQLIEARGWEARVPTKQVGGLVAAGAVAVAGGLASLPVAAARGCFLAVIAGCSHVRLMQLAVPSLPLNRSAGAAGSGAARPGRSHGPLRRRPEARRAPAAALH